MNPALASLILNATGSGAAPFRIDPEKQGSTPLQHERSLSVAATRHSLVGLPLTYAVPGAVSLLLAVIVTETVVDLTSELIYIQVLPRIWKTRFLDAEAAAAGSTYVPALLPNSSTEAIDHRVCACNAMRFSPSCRQRSSERQRRP